MAGILQHLRSSTLDKRPNPASMVDGQVAINYANGAPGMFFKGSNGALVKVGPVHVGSTAPNATPAAGGTAGNSVGEQWLDTSGSTYVFKIWDGSAWRSEAGEFVNTAGDTMTGALGIIAGSQASPSLFFSGDTNTGIYSPGADQVAISTNSTGRLFVDASGNVGINAASTGAISTGIPVIEIKGNSAAQTDRAGAIRFTRYDGVIGAEIYNADGATYIDSKSPYPLIFYTGGGEKMVLDSSGRLGLGTSSPDGLLTVRPASGNAQVFIRTNDTTSRSQLIFGDSADSNTGGVQYDHSTDKLEFHTGNLGEKAALDSSGRLLVGTSTSVTASALQLVQNIANGGGQYIAGNSATSLAQGGSVGYLRFYSNAGGVWNDGARIAAIADAAHSSTSVATRIEFSTTADGASSPTERMRIDAAGTTTLTSATSTAPFIAKITTSEVARIDSSGRLLVGASTARTVEYVPGTVGIPKLQIEGSDGGSSQVLITDTRLDGRNPSLAFAKTRNGAIVAANDILGSVSFFGDDGTDTRTWGGRITCEVDGTPGANDMPGRLVFSTTADGASSPTERMRITKEGVVKISRDGTYISAASGVHEIRTNLDNNNALVISSSASNGTQYGLSIRTANDQNDATRDFLECQGGGVLRAQIRTNGGLANYSANNVNLSDRNAKKGIAPATGTWNCLKEWEIVNFHYKDQSDDADLNMGVIAQQVAESCPEVVTVFQEAKEATETEPAQEERIGVKEQQMMWMAIKALQEAQLRIETLEAEVAALKGS